MERDNVITEGTILVVTKRQTTGCGIVYLKKDSIVEVAHTTEIWNTGVKVYRNHTNRINDEYYFAYIRDVRMATDEEIKMWNDKVYFI